MGAAIGGVTDVVIGRKLWDEWSDYWQSAGADDPFAQFINPVRKHVVSSTRSGDLGWNSTVIDGDPVAYVRALKESDGEGGISAWAVASTPSRSLFLAGVIDELTLTTHPVGRGRATAVRRVRAGHPARPGAQPGHAGRQRGPDLRPPPGLSRPLAGARNTLNMWAPRAVEPVRA